MSVAFNVLPDGDYVEYLRKSRADVEAENRGEGETLAKHRKALLQLAKHHKINITHILEEIASGESIFHRPEMLKLLELVESGTIKGVLVMDIDRLGRGNMQEQGLILTKFKENNVLIITPRKIYDLNNEFDEEYTEFETFMARKELKIITRRLQGGRDRYAEEGNFLGSFAAFGYKAIYDERGDRHLVIDPERAEIVKMMFQWYVEGMGANGIAKRLQSMNIKTLMDKTWKAVTVLQMLRNEVYIGRIQQHKRKAIKNAPNSETKFRYVRVNKGDWLDAKGKHEPIIDLELFHKVQDIMKIKHVPLKEGHKLVNPLAGIIVCGKCGHHLSVNQDTRIDNKPRYSVRCNNPHCKNGSVRLNVIEERVVQAIETYIKDLTISVMPKERKSKSKALESAIRIAEVTLRQLEDQKIKQFDLLEQGIYDKETFLERSKNTSLKISETLEIINKAKKEMEEEQKINNLRKGIIPSTYNVLNLYRSTNDVMKKNILLKQILEKVELTKEYRKRGDDFIVTITPKIK